MNEILLILVLSLQEQKSRVDLQYKTENTCINVASSSNFGPVCKSKVDEDIEKMLKKDEMAYD